MTLAFDFVQYFEVTAKCIEITFEICLCSMLVRPKIYILSNEQMDVLVTRHTHTYVAKQ